ncbi:MAG: hypothetical protein SFV51_09100 [Bryobacteraceae bacterium]|nr:hypothetical protein [Bryobacteraceae bacterium]
MFPNPNVAYAVTVAGVAIGCLELLRPGTIVPGVTGAVLAMLGVASLAAHPITARGVALIALGVLLATLDAKYRLRGAGTAAGTILLVLGARWLVADGDAKIRWTVAAGVSIPFLAGAWWLMDKAFRARANKLDF